jgi:hypothetical protein
MKRLGNLAPSDRAVSSSLFALRPGALKDML